MPTYKFLDQTVMPPNGTGSIAIVSPTTAQVSGFTFAVKLIDPQPRHRARVAATSCILAIDAGFSLSVNVAALVSTNLGVNARARVRGSTVDGSAPSNRLLHSHDYTNAAWTKTGVSANGTGLADGIGGTNASRYDETAVTSDHSLSQGVTGLDDNRVVNVSVYGDYDAERAWIKVRFTNKAGTVFYQNYNVQTGALGLSSGALTDAAVVAGSNGAYRCSFSASTGTGGGTPLVEFCIMDGDNASSSYLGTAGQSMIFFGAQLDYDTRANTYAPTTTAAVVPALDTGFTTQITTYDGANGNVIATFNTVAFRYLRWDITGGTNPIDIGLAPWGATLDVSSVRNPSYGSQFGVNNLAIRDSNPDTGSQFNISGPMPRVAVLNMDLLDEEVVGYGRFHGFWQDSFVGLGDGLVVYEPDSSDTNPWFTRAQRSIYGPYEPPGMSLVNQHFQGLVQKQLRIIERL